MNAICPGDDGDCTVEVEYGQDAECDDCHTLICPDHWITCSGDDDFDGCDAGLCPACLQEHISEHMHERNNGD